MIESRWVRGRVTVAPVERVTPAGDRVTNFTLAESNSSRDKDTGEWKRNQVMYWDCECWSDARDGEVQQAALGLVSGAEVVVRGWPRMFKAADGRLRMRLKVEKIYTPLGVANDVGSKDVEDEQPPF